MPVSDWKLTGDQGGAAAMAVFDDLQQVVTLLLIQHVKPPVTDDEQLGFGQLHQQLAEAAVAVSQGQRVEQPAGTEVAHRLVSLACHGRIERESVLGGCEGFGTCRCAR